MSGRILVLGDCCAPPGETVAVDDALKAVIAGHDLTICVLEGPVQPQIRTSGPADKSGPRLCQDANTVAALKSAGIGCFALGNNHIADHGAAGIATTLESLPPSLGVGVGSDDQCALDACLVSVGGSRIAIFSACERQAGVLAPGERGPGCAWLCHPDLPHRIATARKEADAVLLIAHAGVEEIDLPLPQWRDHYRRLVEAGCSAVIGSHPHVPLAHEYHHDSLIVHSLGNLYMPAGVTSPHPWWSKGMGVSLELGAGRGVSSWRPVATTFSPGRIGLGDQLALELRLEGLGRILADSDAYREAIGICCEDLWRERYRSHFIAMLGLDSRRALVRQALGAIDATGDPVMAIHNLVIESHRWAVETAMRHRLRTRRVDPLST